MNNQTVVDVFLGHPLVDRTEEQFLRRLRRDLALRGLRARMLANLQVGRDYRQLDFVIVTDHRVVLCELKAYTDPVIGRCNGRWEKTVAGVRVPLEGNPFRQAQDGTYALSDTMHLFARGAPVPGPRKAKFFMDVDTVVCLFPTVPASSQIEKHRYVTVVSYDDLLARLQRPGPTLSWSDEHWDALVRHLGLYRDGEDADAARALRTSAAAVDEYRARFLHVGQADMPPLVPTKVTVAGRLGARPNLTTELIAGRSVLVRGASGLGKTLWARDAANELARAGHVPIWLQAGACDDAFGTSVARAVATYTTLAPSQLLAAAESAGRAVTFVVDGLNECPAGVRASLMAGVQALQLRSATHGLLITTQAADEVPAQPHLEDVELLAPDDPERRAVLAAYGAESIVDHAEALTTPLELSLAAACAGDIAPMATSVELLDRYVDRAAEGEATRAVLRSIAWRMHTDIRLALRAPDVVRTARRDLGLDIDEVQAALDCDLLTVAQGRVSFRHERFARFLAADALLLSCKDAGSLARALNEPRSAPVRRDAVALEPDGDRLGIMLSALDDPDVLVDAATGQLGSTQRRLARAILVDALHVASARTTSGAVSFAPGELGGLDDSWTVPWIASPSDTAQLTAIGRCLRQGLFVHEVGHLLDQTDALCAGVADAAAGGASPASERTFAATYAFGRPATDAVLPASTIVWACVEDHFRHRTECDPSSNTARVLLERSHDPGFGTLYVATSLLRSLSADCAPLVPSVVAACLASGAYHLRLEGLQLIEDSVRHLDEVARGLILDAVRDLRTDDLFLNSAVTDALSALGDIVPARTVEDLLHEIQDVLRRPEDSIAWRQAGGIVSAQFENEDVVGPYAETLSSLSREERDQLLVMALRAGSHDDVYVMWAVEELQDLSHPVVRAALSDFLRTADPSSWHSTQWGMASVMRALEHFARTDLSLPAPQASETDDGAWRAFLDVVLGVLRRAAGRPPAAAEDLWAWDALVGEHRHALADLLSHLHFAKVVIPDRVPDVEALVLQAMPREATDVLVWSVEHPERLRSPLRWSRPVERARHTMELLGRTGDQAAADAMRRFVNDRELGATALAAVREIEARAVA